MRAKLDPQRIAEIRAAWRQDRHERLASLRHNWHWHALDFLFDVCGGFAFGVALGLAGVIFGLSVAAEGF